MRKSEFTDLKTKVLNANLDLANSGLIIDTWGNVSGYDHQNGIVAIKPSGMPYETMSLDDIVVTDLNGKIIDGTTKPSVDLPIHLEIYRNFPMIGGIAHTHSVWATIWAQAGKAIPILGTTHADFFEGDIPCTRQLNADEIRSGYEKNTGVAIVEKLKTYHESIPPAILSAGHGAFAWGRNSTESVRNAVALETIAEIAYHTLQLNPDAKRLSRELCQKHYLRKHGREAYYGQQ